MTRALEFTVAFAAVGFILAIALGLLRPPEDVPPPPGLEHGLYGRHDYEEKHHQPKQEVG